VAAGSPSKLGPPPIEGPAVKRRPLKLLSFLLGNMKGRKAEGENNNNNDV